MRGLRLQVCSEADRSAEARIRQWEVMPTYVLRVRMEESGKRGVDSGNERTDNHGSVLSRRAVKVRRRP